MKRRHFLTWLCLGTVAGRGDPSENTMYMLKYDHGGAILWVTDHFKKYLDSAVDRCPSFKIGLDNNDAYAYAYEFALYPFEGGWQRADLHWKALEYNFPLIAIRTPPGDGRFGRQLKLIEAESPDAIVTALYTAEGRTYARFFDHQDHPVQVNVRYLNGPARLVEVDLAGREKGAVNAALSLQPWQFRTVRIDPKGDK
jgi:hypothetical protein